MALFSIAKTLLSNLLGWIEISNQRRALRELTDQQLHDIGVSRKEAMNEGRRACWDHCRSLEEIGSLPIAPSVSEGNRLEELSQGRFIVSRK